MLDFAIDGLFASSGGGGGGFASAIGSAISMAFGGGGGDTWSGMRAVAAATGGVIHGPGTGTSDSIPAMLSNGEFVVKASATARNRPLLDAINGDRIRHYASGGYVPPAGAATRMQAPANSGSGSIKVGVINNGEPMDATARETTDASGNRQIEVMLDRKIAQRVTKGGTPANRYLKAGWLNPGVINR